MNWMNKFQLQTRLTLDTAMKLVDERFTRRRVVPTPNAVKSQSGNG